MKVIFSFLSLSLSFCDNIHLNFWNQEKRKGFFSRSFVISSWFVCNWDHVSLYTLIDIEPKGVCATFNWLYGEREKEWRRMDIKNDEQLNTNLNSIFDQLLVFIFFFFFTFCLTKTIELNRQKPNRKIEKIIYNHR